MERAGVVVAEHSTKNRKLNTESNLLPLPSKRKPTYLFSVCGGTWMFVTAQLPGDILLGGQSPTPCGSLESRSGLQTWRQMPLPVELCCQPNRAFWVKRTPSSAHALLSAPWLVGSWEQAERKHWVALVHSLPFPGPFITLQFLGIVTRVILEAL